MYPSDYARIRESTFYNANVKRDIRIVSIGDIHISQNVELEAIDKILKVIEELKPDYICLLGDIIDSPTELTYEKRLLELEVLIKSCNNIANTFIIIGNHDFYYDKDSNTITLSHIWEDYDKLDNVYLLKDKSFTDDNIFIGGYMQKGDAYYSKENNKEDPMNYYIDLGGHQDLYKKLPSDKFKLFLTHSPEPIQSVMNQNLLKDYNLIITGHYHNGVVPSFLEWAVPKNKGLLTPRRTVLPNEARGVVKLDTGTYLIYNGGWTNIPNTANSIYKPLDVFFNRDIDLTTVTNNYEYYDSYVKTKKLKLR